MCRRRVHSLHVHAFRQRVQGAGSQLVVVRIYQVVFFLFAVGRGENVIQIGGRAGIDEEYRQETSNDRRCQFRGAVAGHLFQVLQHRCQIRHAAILLRTDVVAHLDDVGKPRLLAESFHALPLGVAAQIHMVARYFVGHPESAHSTITVDFHATDDAVPVVWINHLHAVVRHGGYHVRANGIAYTVRLDELDAERIRA